MTDTILSLAAAKLHLRVDDDDEDDLISDAIAAAQAWVEAKTILVLTPRTVVETFDSLSPRIELRSWPVTSIDAVSYRDRSGAEQVLAIGGWFANLRARPARLSPPIGGRWPAAACVAGGVSVSVTAGFASASEVPATVMHAIKLLISHFYTNRTPVEFGPTAAAVELPLTVADLLREWKRRLI